MTTKNFDVMTDGRIAGPKDYMSCRFDTFMDLIYNGQSVLYKEAMLRSPDFETAIAVCLETDYNAWKNTAHLANRMMHPAIGTAS